MTQHNDSTEAGLDDDKPDVVVMGSCNVDHTLEVARLPRIGETLTATRHSVTVGGKGLNQAIAAARAGACVSLVARVGRDDAGEAILATLEAAGVDLSEVRRTDTPSGTAFIFVDEAGSNEIVVAPGANAEVVVPPGVRVAKVLLAQLEIQHAAVAAAMEAFSGIVVLNPAPSRDAARLLGLADVIVPNATELADLAGSDDVPQDPGQVVALLRTIDFDAAAVVTLGDQGAVVVADAEVWHLRPPAVAPLDTTGAGDAFCGVLAARLARGDSLVDAARAAVAAGTVAVTRHGAGPAMPSAAEVGQMLDAVTVTQVTGPRSLPRPPGFIWGVATSAFQIEGSTSADGRQPSIWDAFVDRRGAVVDGADADVAAASYERWQDDVRLASRLGVQAYRLSFAWPRLVQADGTWNSRGQDYYDRLVDALLARNVQPFVTLYHWDLPLAVESAGGWPSRSTAERFADYAACAASRFGDRVEHWFTVNEPFEASMRGYAQGKHAPGLTDPAQALRAAHHLLLGHGLATAAIRAESPSAQVGIVLNLYPIEAASDRADDIDLADRVDLVQNRLFLGPVLRGAYDGDARELLARHGANDVVLDGDELCIGSPTDHLGVNYYTVHTVAAGGAPEAPSPYVGASGARLIRRGRCTDMGLEVRPDGLRLVLDRLGREYAPPAVYVTENGAAYRDIPGPSGIADFRRQNFLRRHAEIAGSPNLTEVDVRGYFAWTLLDNFEWSDGFTQQFGLVAVERSTGRRTTKASFEWYARQLRSGREEGHDR